LATDEAQWVPALVLASKLAVDQNYASQLRQ
jgi:hypothetical protein